MCFESILQYIFTTHLIGIFVSNSQIFSFEIKKSEIRILDLTSNQQSGQAPLCLIASQDEEILTSFEEA